MVDFYEVPEVETEAREGNTAPHATTTNGSWASVWAIVWAFSKHCIKVASPMIHHHEPTHERGREGSIIASLVPGYKKSRNLAPGDKYGQS